MSPAAKKSKQPKYPWVPSLTPAEIAAAEALVAQVKADTMILPEQQRAFSKIFRLANEAGRIVEEVKRFNKWAAENE